VDLAILDFRENHPLHVDRRTGGLNTEAGTGVRACDVAIRRDTVAFANGLEDTDLDVRERLSKGVEEVLDCRESDDPSAIG
jgi:hypothetical protein